MKRSLILILSIVLALSASTLGTLAYLADEDSVVNTLTVGNVAITVDEAAVNTSGEKMPNEPRRKSNTYHLIPGMTYTKDPTLTVEKGSSESYVRMLVTLDHYSEIKEIDSLGGELFVLENLVGGIMQDKWLVQNNKTIDQDADTITFEYRYFKAVDASAETEDQVLAPLFTSFTIPAEVTNDELQSIDNMKITVCGHAIQATGFTDADAAWNAFDQQIDTQEDATE